MNDEEKRQARNAALIEGIFRLAAKMRPYHMVRRDEVAAEAGVSNGTINHAFGTLDKLRTAAMAEAVKRENLLFIAQGLANGDPVAKAASPELKERAIRAIV